MKEHRQRQLAFARLLGHAVSSQALLSAASFAIGVILLRGTSTVQYGYYVLVAGAILLLTSLQGAFIGPPLAIRMAGLDPSGRGQLIGSLYREQRRILFWIGLTAGAVVCTLLLTQSLQVRSILLVLAAMLAGFTMARREFFRMMLLAHRLPLKVLRIDLIHVALLLTGVMIATTSVVPATVAVLALGGSALVSGLLLARTLQQHQPWSMNTAPNLLRQIAPLAAWSTAGSAIHWAFSQGYIYLVAATLDVTAVAALAATRLLLMPVNLLSTGIGSLMMPAAAGWLHRHGSTVLLRRLCLLAAGMAAAALCYFLVLWLMRDWLFSQVLRKQFAQQDQLLMMWGAIFLVIVVRDQLVYLLAVQGRFRALTMLALASAMISLTASYWGIRQFGVTGALLGVLVGELINAAGVAILSSDRGAGMPKGISPASSAALRNSP